MINRTWRLSLILVIAKIDLLLADTGMTAEATPGLSLGLLIVLSLAGLMAVVVIFSFFAWFIRGSNTTDPVQTKEKSLEPFENQQDEDFFRWICEEAANQTGTDIARDALAMKRLHEAFGKATKELESAETAEINLPFIAVKGSGPCHFKKTLSRADLQRFQA